MVKSALMGAASTIIVFALRSLVEVAVREEIEVCCSTDQTVDFG